MKRKTTKEILAESFRELAETRPVDKITVQEIVDNCEYSPATFYRHFKDKYDLTAWDYVHRTTEIMNKIGKDEYEWKDTLWDAMTFYLKNKEYIRNLIKNTGGHDAFVRYMSEANIAHLTKHILKLSGQKQLDRDIAIHVRVYCCGTVQTVCEWLIDNIKCDPDHLADIFEQALPVSLRNILFTI